MIKIYIKEKIQVCSKFNLLLFAYDECSPYI